MTLRDPLIVINADDLGRSSQVNAAVLEAFRAGLISSASIMSNMPGFDEACHQVRADGLQDRIGVHLNLTEGRAMTTPIRQHALLSLPSGDLLPRGHTIWRLSRREALAVETELAAQVEAVLAAGVKPNHLDSHHHIHTLWPIGAIVISVARRYDVPAVRIARNCGAFSSTVRKTYRRLLNVRLSRAGLSHTRYFGSAADVLALPRLDGPVEVMVHPEHDSEGRLVDCIGGASRFEDAISLEPVVEGLRRIGRIVSYAALTSGSDSP